MITINIRDPKHQSELAPEERWKITGTITKPKVVIFIHGYNNNPAEARRTTAIIEMYKNGYGGFDLALLSWPSNARWWNYSSDKMDAKSSALTLAKIIKQLRSEGREVALIGHSMGNYLIAETLHYLLNNEIEYWFALNSDIAQSDCTLTGDYGQYSDKVGKAIFFFTPTDGVINIISYVRNKFRKRIGAHGLAKKSPVNWVSSNLKEFTNETDIDHSDCFQMPDLWRRIYGLIEGIGEK